jgi:hypothetical protein
MRRRHPLKLLFVCDLPLESRADAEGLEAFSKGLFDIFVVVNQEVPTLV